MKGWAKSLETADWIPHNRAPRILAQHAFHRVVGCLSVHRSWILGAREALMALHSSSARCLQDAPWSKDADRAAKHRDDWTESQCDRGATDARAIATSKSPTDRAI